MTDSDIELNTSTEIQIYTCAPGPKNRSSFRGTRFSGVQLLSLLFGLEWLNMLTR